MACLQVARGPQGYNVVEFIAFRYRDLKEGRDGAHLNASVKRWALSMKCIFCHTLCIRGIRVSLWR